MKYNKKIYYLHIPKTAGTVLNTFLQQGVSKDRIIEHIEVKQNILSKDENIYDKYDFISGHIPFENIEPLVKTKLSNYMTVATFRDPMMHLYSHITFVKEFKVYSRRFRDLPESIQKIVRKLNEIDLSSVSDLKEFIDWLEKNNLYLFHNVQTVYLSKQPLHPVGLVELKRAMKNIEKIDFIGIQERLDEFMLMLAYYLGFEPHDIVEKRLNTTKSRYGLDIDNQDVKKVLNPLYGLDMILYDKAKKIFFDQFYDFIKSIEIDGNNKFRKKFIDIISHIDFKK